MGTMKLNHNIIYYKQLTRAGRPGMTVATVKVETEGEQGVNLIAFASNNTKNPDAFIVLNFSENPKKIDLSVTGSKGKDFKAIRTSSSEKYSECRHILTY